MSKYDIYLQDNSNVLKNKLGITDENALDKAVSPVPLPITNAVPAVLLIPPSSVILAL